MDRFLKEDFLVSRPEIPLNYNPVIQPNPFCISGVVY